MTKITHSDGSSNGKSPHEPRDKVQSMIRGARQRCPNCGKGAVFSAFLKVVDHCKTCDEELHHQRSDDGAPYFTITIIGHVLVPLILLVEKYIAPPYWFYAVALLPLVLALTYLILPRVKGAIVGLQWALYLHGFDPNERAKPDLSSDQKVPG